MPATQPVMNPAQMPMSSPAIQQPRRTLAARASSSNVLLFPQATGLDRNSDHALLARIAAADAEALSLLYDRHASVVLGVLTRMLGGGGEAEEVLQEVFLQVWRQAGRFRPELASPRGWLLMMARSRALDRIKSATASRRREEAIVEESPAVAAAEGSSRLEQEEERARVRRALAALSAEQRQAIELAFFVGLSHSQIAERLGAPLGTVKSRVLLGMRKMRQLLAEPPRLPAVN